MLTCGEPAGHVRRAGAAAVNARGFTLVEMLVVMTVVLILLGLAIPVVGPVVRGIQITQGGRLIEDQLELARQLALSKNRTVEVRLCRPTKGKFTILQTLIVSPGGQKVPADKAIHLPDAVIMDGGAPLSSLLNQSGRAPTPAMGTDPAIGALGTAYDYVPFQFKPDGSTDLVQYKPDTSGGTSAATSLWFVTLHNSTDGDNRNSPPSNYYTLQVDAYDGHVAEFRP